MDQNKKQELNERQRQIANLHRNKKILRSNVLILSVGLALSFIGKESIGEPIIWLGIIIFAYTTYSNITIKKSLKQQKRKV
ncbi:hypothetical protein V7O66_06110 [Methanolobus sp. ZRKC3]|uniref:hypothetical protein n=1 Tax=Methanolobus sp. ZRKC3 TaxID=3125786 RepID=UPI003248641B